MNEKKPLELALLKQFLGRANMPHATGSAEVKKEDDGSRTIVYSEGDWVMNDNFFGGEPYGGRQVIHYKNEPVWMTVYYGRVFFNETELAPDEVYDFLRKALQYPPEDSPYRGPKSYRMGDLEYRNEFEGDVDDYSGKEVILENGKQIYWAVYLGGLVDRHARGSM